MEARFMSHICSNAHCVFVQEKRQMVVFLFVPTVDKFAAAHEVFLPAHPYDLISAGKFQHVPYIMGANSMEGLIHLHGISSH